MKKIIFILSTLLFLSCKKETKYYYSYRVECERCDVVYTAGIEAKTERIYGNKTFINHTTIRGAALTITNLSHKEARGIIFERGKKINEIFLQINEQGLITDNY